MLDRIPEQKSQSSFTYFDQMESARKILNIQALRRHQLIVVDNVLQYKNQLISIATSGGKSLIYTLPTIILNKISIVITPTIALRNDQVQQLEKINVQSYQLSSTGSGSIQPHQMLTINSRSVVFVTPEKLNSEETISILKQLVKLNKIALFAIDECHLMVDWQDFRKDFSSIPQIFNECRNEVTNSKQPPVLALTASVSPDDTEIIQEMFSQCGIIMESLVFDVYRPNLNINIIKTNFDKQCKSNEIKNILIQTAIKQQKDNQILSYEPRKTIIYWRSKQNNEEMKSYLKQCKIDCVVYHSQVCDKEQNIKLFTSNRCQVIAATIAFGMGINIPDVRQVINADIPSSINEFLQKIGRSGRDQVESWAIQLFSLSEIHFTMKLFLRGKTNCEFDEKRKQARIMGLIQLWEVELLFLVYYVSNYILKYFATSNADDKFQQTISSWRLFMNYSLTQDGQKYDFDRIRSQSTIQSQYLIFQKVKIEIATCNKRRARTKINAVEDVQGRPTNSLNKLRQIQSVCILFISGSNGGIHKILYQSELVISLVQDVPVQFLRFSQQSSFMKDFISKIYGCQAGLEKGIRGSNDWCTDAICNLQLVAQSLNLQGTSVFIFNWVNLNDFRYFLITKNNGGLFLSISTGSSR
ncbi:ATP-dependent_DNA helicase RecQ [Hexamita inflata]|uniref:DNA 3'-5' helicase n=1 Tax=Hexamita inflata TaxID=28002 RepID=A0ABP1GUF3_9EUKA